MWECAASNVAKRVEGGGWGQNGAGIDSVSQQDPCQGACHAVGREEAESKQKFVSAVKSN